MVRTLLIVDDVQINREILKNLLGDEYQTLEAGNGEEALAVLRSDASRISAILLDLSMPVMDGFALLETMRGDEKLSQIPVIVMTGSDVSDSEEKALSLGANDYVSKPYKPAIIRQRIRNTIRLRETAAAVNALQKDRLTGLYNREKFFELVKAMVSEKEAGYYTMACFDVDKFKVINDQYGTQKGDEALKHIARIFREGFEKNGGICCRVSADDYATLYPTAFQDSPELAELRINAANVEGLASPLAFSIGRYIVNDVTLSPSAMYDRAMLAAASIKGRYDAPIAIYQESMRDNLLHEQKIVTQMDVALAEHQFEIWFQPQYNHSTGAMIGAEALVRWRHPEKGLIPPGVFVPVFEQNGFIYALDQYVWSEACRYLKAELEAGRSPLPVSVNISRYDVFCADFVEVLTGLIRKYGIPVELLRLEITESAFSESTKRIVGVVRELIRFGFTMEIDDFGSGYSSLNTLKSVPAQVVKLDMRFFEGSDDSQRSGNIIESVVRMTKWLGMSVIAEGVEKKEQADFLRSIGCNYIQGYLYAKPVPEADYRELCRGAGKEEKLLSLETVENMDNNAFWSPESMDTLIFNSYVGAACIYEYYQGKIELLRTTEKYAQMIGSAGMSIEDALRLDWTSYLDADSQKRLTEDLNRSVETKQEIVGEYRFLNLPGCQNEIYLHFTMRVIASAGNRYLVYCTSENMTAQRKAEKDLLNASTQMKDMMDDIPGGFSRIRVTADGSLLAVYVNRGMSKLTGMTRDELMGLYANDALAGVHPDDVKIVQEAVAKMLENGEAHSSRYRLLRADGKYVWLSIFGRITVNKTGEKFLNIYYLDATEEVREENLQKKLLDNLPYGAALYEFDGKKLSVIHLNKRYWELVNREERKDIGENFLSAVYSSDLVSIKKELSAAIREKRDLACDIRILCGDGGYRPFHIVGRILPIGDGTFNIYASYTPITNEAMSIQEMLPIALDAVMDSQSEYVFVKDKNLRYVCCSRKVAALAGSSSEAEMIGKTDYELFEKKLADNFSKDDRRILETGESLPDHIDRIPSDNGADRYACTSKFPLKDSKGNVVGLYGVGRDITETRFMKSQFELLTNSIPGGIATYEYRNGKIRITYFSDGFCHLFHLTREEYTVLSAENVFVGIFDEDIPVLRRQLDALFSENTQVDCLYRVHLKNGGYKWINLKASSTERDEKKIVFNAVLLDITERQEATEKLRISEEENRLAMSHSKNFVCRYQIAERTLQISSTANKDFCLPETIANIPYAPVQEGKISSDTAEAYIRMYESIGRGKKEGETVYKRMATSGWRWLEAHYSTIFAADGKPVSTVISYADITEQIEKDAAYKRWQESFRGREEYSYSLFRCNLSRITSNNAQGGNLLTLTFEDGEFDFNQRAADYASKCVFKEDRTAFVEFLNVDGLLASYYQGKRILSLDYREKLREGVRWLRLTINLAEQTHSSGVETYLLFENIDTEKREELANRARAESDPLTGTLNRSTFESRVNMILSEAKPGTRHVMMMLDVDGFK